MFKFGRARCDGQFRNVNEEKEERPPAGLIPSVLMAG